MNGGTLKRALRKMRKICKKCETCEYCPLISASQFTCFLTEPARMDNEEIENIINMFKAALSYDLSNDVQNKPK